MALDIFNTFATDEDLEVNGTWVALEDASNAEGTQLLIARDGNAECEVMVEALLSKYADELASADEKASARVRRKIEIEVAAKTLLKGWKNLNYKGSTLEFSEDNAAKVLGHRDFRQLVMYHARQRAAYMQKLEDDVTKN